MSIGEILAIDLPTIIVVVVLWILNQLGIRKVDRSVNEIKTSVSRLLTGGR
jgi:hypothetical protein